MLTVAKGCQEKGVPNPSLREEAGPSLYQTTMKKDLSWWGIFSAGYTVLSAWLTLGGTLTISVPYDPANAI